MIFQLTKPVSISADDAALLTVNNRNITSVYQWYAGALRTECKVTLHDPWCLGKMEGACEQQTTLIRAAI